MHRDARRRRGVVSSARPGDQRTVACASIRRMARIAIAAALHPRRRLSQRTTRHTLPASVARAPSRRHDSRRRPRRSRPLRLERLAAGTITNLMNLVLPVTKSRVTQNSSRPPWKTPENYRSQAACLVRFEAPYVSDGFDFQYRVGVSFDANGCLSTRQSARWASRYPCKACQ